MVTDPARAPSIFLPRPEIAQQVFLSLRRDGNFISLVAAEKLNVAVVLVREEADVALPRVGAALEHDDTPELGDLIFAPSFHCSQDRAAASFVPVSPAWVMHQFTKAEHHGVSSLVARNVHVE